MLDAMYRHLESYTDHVIIGKTRQKKAPWQCHLQVDELQVGRVRRHIPLVYLIPFGTGSRNHPCTPRASSMLYARICLPLWRNLGLRGNALAASSPMHPLLSARLPCLAIQFVASQLQNVVWDQLGKCGQNHARLKGMKKRITGRHFACFYYTKCRVSTKLSERTDWPPITWTQIGTGGNKLKGTLRATSKLVPNSSLPFPWWLGTHRRLRCRSGSASGTEGTSLNNFHHFRCKMHGIASGGDACLLTFPLFSTSF